MKHYFCFFLLILSVYAEKARYDNYRVYKLTIENANQFDLLKHWQHKSDSYIFFKEPTKVGSDAELLVPPHKFSEFTEMAEKFQLENEILISNLQEIHDNQLPSRRGGRMRREAEEMTWTDYHSLETINAWMDSLAEEFPNIVSVETLVKSPRGREMKVLKLSKKSGNRAIFIESNIHAREWITAATTTWMINELLRSTNAEAVDLASNIDWYFIPVLNPDGYEYTRHHNRNWRKTRSIQTPLCSGVDANRNFGFNWMVPDENGNTGTSSSSCNDIFPGYKAFSEVETAALDQYLREHHGKFDAYIAMHSYGHMILYPYGNSIHPVHNQQELQAIGEEIASRIYAKNNIQYTVGSWNSVLYTSSGASQDHAYGEHGIPIAYTIEMRGNGEEIYGNYGFFLPPAYIIPNAEEVFEGFKGLVKKAREFGYFSLI